MPNKALAVAKYILNRRLAVQDTLSPMQLIKLAYIAHGFMLGWKGEPLLDEPVQAWRYGPVVPSIYHAIKSYRSEPVDSIPGAEHDWPFTENEKTVMNYVADAYAEWNAIQLSDATHRQGTPWSTTWQLHRQNSPISNDIIQNFYSSIMNNGIGGKL